MKALKIPAYGNSSTPHESEFLRLLDHGSLRSHNVTNGPQVWGVMCHGPHFWKSHMRMCGAAQPIHAAGHWGGMG